MPTRMRSTMSTWTTRVHECRYTIWWPGNCFYFCVRLIQLLHAIPIASTKKLVPFWPMTIIRLYQYYWAKIALFARRIAPFANIKQLPTFAFQAHFVTISVSFPRGLTKVWKTLHLWLPHYDLALRWKTDWLDYPFTDYRATGWTRTWRWYFVWYSNSDSLWQGSTTTGAIRTSNRRSRTLSTSYCSTPFHGMSDTWASRGTVSWLWETSATSYVY